VARSVSNLMITATVEHDIASLASQEVFLLAAGWAGSGRETHCCRVDFVRTLRMENRELGRREVHGNASAGALLQRD
jgi:hypothetical protein